MNRTLKNAVRRYHDGSHDQLRSHLRDFVNTYNLAQRLNRRLTSFEFIVRQWPATSRTLSQSSRPSHKGTKYLADVVCATSHMTRPSLHEAAPLLEVVCPTIRALDLGPICMAKGCLGHLARKGGRFGAPIPK
jgi:hypothetical protein